MEFWMWILICLIVCQRLVELVIAKNNERWMKKRGAVEIGEKHHIWFILLHSLFFVSIVTEVMFIGTPNQTLHYYLIILFIMTQLGRVWCIYTLGRFWNTKVIILPGTSIIKKGPYKYIKHPNYIIVALELIIIPLLFGAYITAITFPILHILLLIIRIPIENRALENKMV